VVTVRWRFLLCATLMVALAWHDGEAQVPAPEPVYRGRPFEEWRRDLQGGTPMVRERAVVALCEFGEPAVPLLVAAIADQDFNVRTLAIFCLGRLGSKAKDAVPALVKTLEDRDWIVRKYAAGALGLLEVTAVDAAPALARTAVEDFNSEVRQTATFALGRLGPAARETARPILQQLSSAGADEAVRNRAAELLRDMEKR
jgi:HEAT repeat protein